MPTSSRVAPALTSLLVAKVTTSLFTMAYQSDYRFGVDQGQLTVTNIASGAVDTLDGIETLEFADGPIGVSIDGNGGFAALRLVTRRYDHCLI